MNFNTIGLWDMVYGNITSLVVFCSTLKFLKLLRFNNKINLLSSTLRKASRDLFGFSITFIIIFFAFTQFSLLIFGAHVKSYRNFNSALSSIFRFSLGQFNLKELQHASYFYGSLYFILFILIVIMGLMSMFITILNEAFEKCKKELESKKNEYEFVEYFYDKVKGIKSIGEGKKRGNNRVEVIETRNAHLNDASVDVTVKEAIRKPVDYSSFYSTSFTSLGGEVSKSLANYNNNHDNDRDHSF